MAVLGMNLLNQKKWSEAEPVLRECLKAREAKQPDEWSTFNTRAHLGWALKGLKRYEEAEPLVVSGYEGIKAREDKIPPQGKMRLPEAECRVIQLYQDWGRPEKAAEWKAKLGMPDLPEDVFAR